MSLGCFNGAVASNSALANPVIWYNPGISTTLTKAYRNLTQTGTGTSGTTIITANSSVANLVQAGQIIRIGGTDTYTVASVSTVTINTVQTLSTNYVAQALALDGVSQMNDISGNSNTATQSTDANKPTYSPLLINNTPALVYDSTNSVMTVATSATSDGIFNAGGTMVFVVKINSTGEGTVGRLCEKNTANYLFTTTMATGGACKLSFLYDFSGASDGQWTTTNTDLTFGTPAIIGVTYDNRLTTNVPQFYANSITAKARTTNSTGIGTAVSDSGKSLSIGNRAALDRTLDGGIGWMGCYKRILSAYELTMLFNTLAANYGVTLT